MPHPDSLFLYVQAPLRQRGDGTLLVEAQAANGLRLWAENFPRLIVGTLVIPSEEQGGYVPLSRIGDALDRIEFLPLPAAYRPGAFLAALPDARRRIRAAIGRSRWLCFAIGGLFGDWGTVAALEAHRTGRNFSVWTDRVESDVTRHFGRTASGKAALRARLTHRPMAALERHVIRRASLGLFHGRDTFDAYAPFSRQPELVHDIHLSPADRISSDALAAKRMSAREGPLRIFYAGRVDAMKGPMDWLACLDRLAAAGVDFTAEWIGTGPLLPALRAAIESRGLGHKVQAVGNIDDRAEVLRRFRAASVLLFCHQTAEAPRCLIEALMSGTPIIGYDTAYPRDLISDHGGGRLTPRGDIDALASSLAALASDRDDLSAMIASAARDGCRFDDETVFRHRSDLIKRHL